MKTNKIIDVLNKKYPFSLAPFEFNGLLTDGVDKDIKRVEFSLGYSRSAIESSLANSCDLTVFHNIPEKIFGFHDRYFQDLANLISINDLEICRLHLPLDFAKNGIIDELCKILELPAVPTNLIYEGQEITGGVYLFEGELFQNELLNHILKIHPKSLRMAGKEKNVYKRIAITSGDGCKPEFLTQLKPDAFICGLLNQEAIRVAEDLGILLVEATSYSTESPPFKKVVEKISSEFFGCEVIFIDNKNSIKYVNII